MRTGFERPALNATAPAKVNLVLRVGPTRPDRYHELASLIVALEVGDEIELEPAASTTVEAPALPGGDSLVARALDLLCERSGHRGGFAVQLDKRVPAGAGLGSGSADAGVALRLANRLLETPLDQGALVALAAEVGSDVPFFAAGHAAAEMRGRGESVRAVRLHARPVIAVVWPGVALSTADVYAAYSTPWSEQGFARAADSVALAARADLRTLTALVANDLADVAERLCPASAALRRALRARGALVTTVSGSGSAVFGIFETRGDAEAALGDLPGAAWSAVSGVLDAARMTGP